MKYTLTLERDGSHVDLAITDQGLHVGPGCLAVIEWQGRWIVLCADGTVIVRSGNRSDRQWKEEWCGSLDQLFDLVQATAQIEQLRKLLVGPPP